MSEWYTYDPLTSDSSIRLLRLRPSSFEAQVEFDLFEASNEQYEALSYTWGIGSETVICNHHKLDVRPNCVAALRRLRYPDRPRTLWIDAICIDQGSTSERNKQITMMGGIYSKATDTICWLGEGTVYTKEVMTHLDRIGRCPSQRGLDKLMRFEESLHLTDSSCLDHIFCHDWHRRVWTVQEVAFSRNCHILCGESIITWEHYAAAAVYLIYDQFVSNLDIRASEAVAAIELRRLLRDQTLRPQDDTTLMISCLTDAIYLDATNSLDKIYGLCAMYSKFGVSFPPANYEQSPAEVYTEATFSFIVWSGSLRLLINACSIHRDSTFPSWVPDWRDKSTRLYMPPSHIESRCAADRVGNRLVVRGKIIGRIQSVVMRFPTHLDGPGILSSGPVFSVEDVDFLRLLIQKVGFFRDLLAYVQGDVSDLLDSLTLGMSEEIDIEAYDVLVDLLLYPGTKFDISVGLALAGRWRDDDVDNAVYWTPELFGCAAITASLISGSVRTSGEVLSCLPAVLDLVKDFAGNLADQAILIFDLDDTSICGSAFAAAMVDDAVALLEGAEWPVLLRHAPTGDEIWQFVSPAFVMEIIDDQHWNEVDGSAKSLRTFELV